MIINKLGDNYNFVNNVKLQNNRTEVSSVEKISAKDMTMEEYKKYIYDKISGISENNGNLTEVYISEDGFEAMKNDPDYEKWVLNQISLPIGDKDSFSIYIIGKDRNSMRYECWSPEDMKKRRKIEEKEREFWKRKQKKELEAKMEHYAQYKRMLQENTIRKAEIELNHISGIYDDYHKSSQSLNAAASYKAIMNSGIEAGEKSDVSITVNIEKRSRQIISAKTSEQIKAILLMLKKDLSEYKTGLENGICGETEVSKTEELIRIAEEKQSQMPVGSDSEDNNDMSFSLKV